MNESLNINEAASIIEEDHDPNQMSRREDLRLITRRQRVLYDEAKWSVFFNAPPIYFDISGRDDTVELSETAEVTRGITTNTAGIESAIETATIDEKLPVTSRLEESIDSHQNQARARDRGEHQQ